MSLFEAAFVCFTIPKVDEPVRSVSGLGSPQKELYHKFVDSISTTALESCLFVCLYQKLIRSFDPFWGFGSHPKKKKQSYLCLDD